jgi:hypothetical protein
MKTESLCFLFLQKSEARKRAERSDTEIGRASEADRFSETRAKYGKWQQKQPPLVNRLDKLLDVYSNGSGGFE